MNTLTVRYKARLGRDRAWSSSNQNRAQPREKRDTPAPAQTTAPTVPRIARLLALAHYVERGVRDSRVCDYTTAARSLGMSQPRMAQILDLLFLSPAIQADIVTGQLSLTEHRLRDILGRLIWDEQDSSLAALHRAESNGAD